MVGSKGPDLLCNLRLLSKAFGKPSSQTQLLAGAGGRSLPPRRGPALVSLPCSLLCKCSDGSQGPAAGVLGQLSSL